MTAGHPAGDGPDAGELPPMDVPHPARIYDYWLGGKDNFRADRAVAWDVEQVWPEVTATALANRYFLARVVRHVVSRCAIRQILDIGTGLPTETNTHDIAQREAPECRVVYADNDPVVMAHARALLTSTSQGACAYIDADLRDPASILTKAAATLDLSRPVAVLLLAMLHLIPDDAGPAGLVAALAESLPPGSYLAISHLTADFAPGPVGSAVAAYNAAVLTPVTARTRTQIESLLGDLRLLRPGLVPVSEWRPELTDPQPSTADLYAAVAHIPARCP